MKVLEAIQKGSDYLEKHGIESPRLQCEWLLSDILAIPRLQLYLNFEKDLSDSEVTRMRVTLQKRAKGCPLQHLTGKVSFCGIEIRSDRRALIPRPETEFLAEWVWKEALKRRKVTGRPARLLDVGTGTGCIAIAVAFHDPEVVVTATDLSSDALDLATENRDMLGLESRITFHKGDCCEPLKDDRFDIVVSNPPYIESGLIDSLQVEVRDHDPRMALDGGEDGLSFYRRLASETIPFLDENARLFLELGDEQSGSVTQIFEKATWQDLESRKDLAGKTRYFVATRPKHP